MLSKPRIGAMCYYVQEISRTEAFIAMCLVLRCSGWMTMKPASG